MCLQGRLLLQRTCLFHLPVFVLRLSSDILLP